jgi:RNA polymerase sigma-70 factor, ECF subfamily
LKGRRRRAMPIDVTEVGHADVPVHPPVSEAMWIGPVPDRRVLAAVDDPAEEAVMRESVRLAFVAALQHLPPRQRAVLILREVLRWKADEVAELLDTTVVSVNSALQRARATLEERNLSATDLPSTPPGEEDRALLARWVGAFERYDMDELGAMMREDATQSMPPFDMWLEGREDILEWWAGPGIECRGSRVLPVPRANGSPAFGQYKPSPGGGYDPWALQVLELSGGRIVEFTFFLDTETLFPLFGLPVRLDA